MFLFLFSCFFFFNDTATTEIYTLSLHDALPIFLIFIGIGAMTDFQPLLENPKIILLGAAGQFGIFLTLLLALALGRSEEHTSELQSRLHLVCRLLLEKKNTATPSSGSAHKIRRF